MTNYETTSTKPSPVPSTVEVRRPARVLRSLVRGYQHLRAGRPSPCRFYPSCSQYAVEALTTHGAARGTWLALRRVLRCRPFGRHGVDLVPEPSSARSLPS